MGEKSPTTLKQNVINRAIDANLNRLREGLRVCEDIVRFIVGDAKATEGFKRLRYRISKAQDSLGVKKPQILVFRNTKSDVGKKDFINKTRYKTANCQNLLIANMQRAQEALRSLEEFSKIRNKLLSQKFKNIRFSVYALEKKIFEDKNILRALRDIR